MKYEMMTEIQIAMLIQFTWAEYYRQHLDDHFDKQVANCQTFYHFTFDLRNASGRVSVGDNLLSLDEQ